MTHSSASEPASIFDDGELYDILCGNLDYGFDFYVNLAKQADGPVLDICCGTGRILLPCLQAGIDIEGLDLYDGMLDRLRHKAAGLGLNPRLHRADMSDFRLERRFAFIMVPFNAIVHNMTADTQIGCLELCRDHLLPGGVLAFDTFFPSSELINANDGQRAFEGEVTHPETGHPVRMYDTRSFDRVNQIQRSFNEVEYVEPSGTITCMHASHIALRWVYKNEMELLLRMAGFSRWQIFGDFTGRPLEKETDLLVVQAWK